MPEADVDDTLNQWVTSLEETLGDETYDTTKTNVSWSGYFASLQTTVDRPPAITGLLPMFKDNAHSPSMIRHAMDLLKNATTRLNPGQPAVLVLDRPLYAIAKKIQWSYPNLYGEHLLTVLMGGLHIEMAFLSVLGQWLDESGWSTVMSEAKVVTEGRVQGVEKGSSTARGQWSHQVTLASLSILKKEAYENYCSLPIEENRLSFKEWEKMMESEHPQFYFWNMCIKLQSLLMKFLRSQREGDYKSYLDSLAEMIPWMFTFDHCHYARWLSVHLHDLKNLQSKSPIIYEEFMKGHFVSTRSST